MLLVGVEIAEGDDQVGVGVLKQWKRQQADGKFQVK